MRNFIFTVTMLLLLAGQATGQIQWARCYGGTYDEAFNKMYPLANGYVCAGSAESADGDVSGCHGQSDGWIVRLDSAGAIQWQKCLGGTRIDGFISIRPVSDGGYIAVGFSTSSDGDVTGHHGTDTTKDDFWVVKTDSLGNLQWQRSLGGTDMDQSYDVIQTADGGYLSVGLTSSSDGDVTGCHGQTDGWVVKLDSAGNIIWQKCYGGSFVDDFYSVCAAPGGGYVVAGSTTSHDGDATGSLGNDDVWILKIDDTGSVVWKSRMGGSGYECAYCVKPTADSGFIVTGYTNSNDGQVSGNHGGIDVWVAKISALGVLQWQKCLGGDTEDIGKDITQTADGGYLVLGNTRSDDGEVWGNHGLTDCWVIKLNDTGAIAWDACLGGSSFEGLLYGSIWPTPDTGCILATYTMSEDDDVTGAHGNVDAWVVKIGKEGLGVSATPEAMLPLSVYPNPVARELSIHCGVSVWSQLTDITGKIVIPKTNKTTFDLSSLSSGIYLLNVYDARGVKVRTEKVVKE